MSDYPTTTSTTTPTTTAAKNTVYNSSVRTHAIARRQEVSKLYLTGKSQPEIAAHFGVNQSTISRDLEVLRKSWLNSALMDFNTARAQELAKIDALEREYWDAWRRSQEDNETRTTRAKSSPSDRDNPNASTDLEATTRIEAQAGDPRFLQGIQWCIERRCNLLGLDQPKTIGVMIGTKPIDKASDTELTLFIVSEITALLQPSQGAGAAPTASPAPAAPTSPPAPTIIDGVYTDLQTSTDANHT